MTSGLPPTWHIPNAALLPGLYPGVFPGRRRPAARRTHALVRKRRTGAPVRQA
jgi:hypothetical protein